MRTKALPRRTLIGAIAFGAAWGLPAVYLAVKGRAFPSEMSPEGAYARIAFAVARGHVADAFAYLETLAQWCVHTLLDYGKRAFAAVDQAYPAEEKARLLPVYRDAHEARDAPSYFARLAEQRGYVRQLRRDLSGIRRVEISGERATLETQRGTRYAFRRRENGIWGLSLFTADLRDATERAARDLAIVERAAADYRASERVRSIE